MSDKLTTEAFASKIKSKYPQYENVEDSVLVESILEKYPQYSEQVDFKKKEESLPESTDISAPLDSEAPSTEEQVIINLPEVEVSGLTKEQELAEAKKVAEKDASKSLWRQFSDWTVDFASTVVGGVSEAIGLETGVQASENLLKDNAERREKVKKANQVVENDILANPEFDEFAVLFFEGLTRDDFHPPSPGAREKARMNKINAMEKCTVLMGNVSNKNMTHVNQYREDLKDLFDKTVNKMVEIDLRIEETTAQKKLTVLRCGRDNTVKRFLKKAEKIGGKIEYWQTSPLQFSIELERLDE